jgi:iron complex outermembrane receptor protein
MRGGPLALAVGFDHRKEELRDTPAPVITSGNVIGAGGDFKGSDASRNVTAVFGELNVPILRNLEAQVAVRYDKYSDFGNTTNPKIALRWTPTRELLVRTSYNTGFRAPTLPDLFNPRFIGNTNGSHSDPLRCVGSGNGVGPWVDSANECNIQINAQVGGNPNLKPEKSRQWSLGAILEPTPMFSIGTDFWTIRRKNSINTVGDSTIFDVFGAADPLNAGGFFVRQPRNATGGCVGDLPGTPTPAGQPCAIAFVVQTQQNLGKYNVTGQDVSATLRFPRFAAGDFTLRFEGTYIYSYRYQQFTDSPYVNNAGTFTTDNGVISRWHHYVALNWRSGPFGATLTNHFLLGYQDDESNGNPPRRVASYGTWDLQGTWEGWKRLTVTLGVRNLFDRDPPASANSQNFQVGYDPRYSDPHGRTYYAGLRYKFK